MCVCVCVRACVRACVCTYIVVCAQYDYLNTAHAIILSFLPTLCIHFPALSLVCLASYPSEQVSNQIYAALLPQIGKLNVLLDSNEALVAIYQLFTAMDPGTISVQVKHCCTNWLHVCLHTYTVLCYRTHIISVLDLRSQALFTSVLKQHFLTSLSRLFRWLRVVCTVLELMITIFPEITLFKDMGYTLDLL